MRLTPLPTPTITGPSNAGGISLQPILGQGPQGIPGLPGPGSAAWTASSSVTVDAVRQAPDGSWIKSTATRTTRSTFDATEQTFWQAPFLTPGSIESRDLSTTIAQTKVWAKNPDNLVTGAVTLDGSDLVTSAVVKWPDGLPGVLTITSRDSTGSVLAYNVTRVNGGTTTTYTQPAITRNANGAATNVPEMTVA